MVDVGQIFDEALEKCLNNWTILALAVEQGWGGRDTRAKRETLKAEIADILSEGAKKKRPPSYQNEDDVQEFANFLYNRNLQLFHAEADDGSDVEVARVLLRLYSTCRAGDVTFAQEFIQALKATDLAKCEGVDKIEFATDEDALIDKLQGMDVESGEGGSDSSDDSMDEDDHDSTKLGKGKGYSGGAQPVAGEDEAAPTKRPEQEEPIIDEDGFTSVVKSNRRPR